MDGWERCGGVDGVHTCQLDPSLDLHNGSVLDEGDVRDALAGRHPLGGPAMSSSLSGDSVAPVEELLSRW
jgi:hypothetical protein